MINLSTGMPSDDLPVILVSAADAAAANSIVSELLDSEVTCGDGLSVSCVGGGAGAVVELRNKYYRARARLRYRADTDTDTGDQQQQQHTLHHVEAHIIYLQEHECSEDVLRRRAGEAGAGEVRLALCARGVPATVLTAAHQLSYEVVSMAVAEQSGDEHEQSGAARAREALHAHDWPHLQLHSSTAHVAPVTPVTPVAPVAQHAHTDADDEFSPFQAYEGGVRTSSRSSSVEQGSEEEPSEEECVRRAELFADALAALEGARDTARADSGAGAHRVRRAEQLVAAFARALGTDIDRL